MKRSAQTPTARSRYLWSLVLVLLATTLAAAAAETPDAGVIHDSIQTRNDPAQSYALYLPSTYDPKDQWPLVLALDPSGTGATPVTLFQPAAEELGYIVMGSNSSHNGPLQLGIDAVGAMWKDAVDRFEVHPERVYLTGFSGGARMASELAKGSIVAGVIACGAGLLAGDAEKYPFRYVGIAGSWDINYLELRVLTENFNRRGTPSRFFLFEGGHTWPPRETLQAALQWLDLQAVKTGSRSAPPGWVEGIYQNRLKLAQAAESLGDPAKAWREYSHLAQDLDGLIDVSVARNAAARLAKHDAVKRSRKEQRTLDALERREIEAILEDMLADQPSQSADWWQKKIDLYSKWAHRLEQGADLLSKRLLEYVSRNGWEKSWFAVQQKQYDRALKLAKIALLVLPREPRLHFHIAKVAALQGEVTPALDSLEQALSLGLDPQLIESDAAFEKLRSHPRYQQLSPRQ